MTLPTARDLVQFGIQVVTIAPELLLTSLLKGLPEAAQEPVGKRVPFRPAWGGPAEYALIAERIVANPMLNSESIRPDGAIRMAPR